ncbi:MAG: nuclear transport factor 2 family protein [Kofleriaceae bacterium]
MLTAVTAACGTQQPAESLRPSTSAPEEPATRTPAQLEVIAAVERFGRAADARDLPALEAVLHADHRVVFAVRGAPSASTLTRAQFLDGFRAGTFGGTPRTARVNAVEVHGALAHAAVVLDGGGAHFDSRLVFVRGAGGWQLVDDATLFTPPGTA